MGLDGHTSKYTRDDLAEDFTAYSSAIHRFLLSQRGIELATAEDLGHEVFIRYHSYRTRTDVKEPKALLYTIARNVVLDYFRKESRNPLRHAEQDHEPATPPRFDRLVEANQEVAHAIDAAKLGERQKQILGMFYWDRLTIDGIAKTLGISVGTVKKTLHDVRQKLLRELCHVRKKTKA